MLRRFGQKKYASSAINEGLLTAENKKSQRVLYESVQQRYGESDPLKKLLDIRATLTLIIPIGRL